MHLQRPQRRFLGIGIWNWVSSAITMCSGVILSLNGADLWISIVVLSVVAVFNYWQGFSGR
jgi:hypothetical protein